MDVRLHGNSHLHYRVNGGNSRPGENDELPFLSQAEQECLQFFENTIDSLEQSLEEDDRRLAQARTLERSTNPDDQIVGPPMTSSNPGVTVSSYFARPPSPKDQDIIDLVHREPDLVQAKEPIFSPANPDFEGVPPAPESRFRLKPRHDQVDNLASGIPGLTDNSYHPPGCIPTPVLIAQKIAENQSSGTSNLLPASLHRCSSDSEKPVSPSTDHPVKQGPPTSAKPTRFPANINVILSGKERQNQSLPNVNIHERQAQMLANLSGAGTSPRPLEASHPATTETSPKLPEAHVTTPLHSMIHVDRKSEVQRTPSVRSNEDRNPQPSLLSPAVTPSSYQSPPLENKASVSQPSEVTSLEFNSYGGKSIVVNPSVASRGEPSTSPTSHEPKVLPSALSNPSELNSYGGKTKVMTLAPVPVPRSDVPDILSSHMDRNQTLPAKSEPALPELNSYGGKSRSFNPTTGLYRTSESPARSVKSPAPTPAPRPPRHSYHGIVTPQKAASQALPPDHRRRSNSMFRPQGITVQFSGRGMMNESRREALRKLGLLKES